MMNNRLFTGVLAASLLTMAACSDENTFNSSDGTGRINLDLGINTDVVGVPGSRAEYSDVTVDDLTLRLAKADGSYSREFTVSEFQNLEEGFVVGDYTLEAFYGAADADGFECPYYYGSQSLSVTDGGTTNVSLTAQLANALVAVEYTDAFRSYFSAYNAYLLTAASRTIAFANNEVRPAYVAPGEVKLFVDITKPNGTTATLQPATINAEPRHRYAVTLDVNQGAVGDAALVITFDETLDLQPITLDLSDELMNARAPEITVSGAALNAQGEYELNVVEGTALAESLKVNMVARGGLGEVPMTTSSTALAAAGWPASLDLLKATDAQKALLQQMGVSAAGLWHNPDKMGVLDLTNLVKNIPYNANSANRFTIFVKDRFTKVCDPVTIVVNVEQASLALANGVCYLGSSQLTVDLTYNGGNIDAVTLKTLNDRGTYTAAAYTYTRDAANPNLYHLTVTVPAGVDDVELLAQCGSLSATINVVRQEPPLVLAAPAQDVFATHANVNFSSPTVSDAAGLAAHANVFVAEAGGDYQAATVERTQGSPSVTVKNLKPGTAYTVAATMTPGETPTRSRSSQGTVSFTTEGAAQLPNNGMEYWHTDKYVNGQEITGTGRLTNGYKGSSNWDHYYPYTSDASTKGWETVNELTLSAATPSQQRIDFRYVCNSGTISTNDVHSGSLAACVRTVGWGLGNTAAGSASVVKNITPGQLYLGTFDLSAGAPVYGYPFNSRPASLSFWYKYSAPNGADYGQATIRLRDSGGNVIAESSRQISPTGSYTQCTLPLSYATDAAKAATIEVIFISSVNPDCLNKNSLTIGSISASSEQVGASFYVDDITLNY